MMRYDADHFDCEVAFTGFAKNYYCETHDVWIDQEDKRK